LGLKFTGYDVRPARATDLAGCNALCQRVHGHHRCGELDDAIKAGTACVVEHLGRITAYATDVAFFAHAVAETNEGLKALIGAATGFPGGGFLLPTRNGEMFRWCPTERPASGAPDDPHDYRSCDAGGRSHAGRLASHGIAAAAVGAAVTFATLLLVIRFGSHLGKSTQAIVTRFMGLIVASMGMQFVLVGLKAFWAT
jgi:hypothetical protein